MARLYCYFFIPHSPHFFISDQQVLEDQGTMIDTLEFDIKIRCRRNPNAPVNSKNPDELYIDNNCYTKHMKWIPKPGQQELFKGSSLFLRCFNYTLGFCYPSFVCDG